MAFQPLLRHRAVPIAALTAGFALLPKTTLHAESPEAVAVPHTRKPIYDSPRSEPLAQHVHATTIFDSEISPEPAPASSGALPGPTARLAAQIRKSRLLLHSYAVSLEDSVNRGLTSALDLESSFTSTVASLAPPKESGERLLPGAVYVLVAAMAGSIVTRNRNILLRATVPVAAGVGAGYAVLPITTRNVGDLIWKYEERYPVVRDNHIRVKEGVKHFVDTGKAHSQMGYYMAQEKVQGVREAVEEWVKKGK
ncbi:hypothetical protein MBLNU459_g7823t2 [Dothideomycetes sp. NU459]